MEKSEKPIENLLEMGTKTTKNNINDIKLLNKNDGENSNKVLATIIDRNSMGKKSKTSASELSKKTQANIRALDLNLIDLQELHRKVSHLIFDGYFNDLIDAMLAQQINFKTIFLFFEDPMFDIVLSEKDLDLALKVSLEKILCVIKVLLDAFGTSEDEENPSKILEDNKKGKFWVFQTALILFENTKNKLMTTIEKTSKNTKTFCFKTENKKTKHRKSLEDFLKKSVTITMNNAIKFTLENLIKKFELDQAHNTKPKRQKLSESAPIKCKYLKDATKILLPPKISNLVMVDMVDVIFCILEDVIKDKECPRIDFLAITMRFMQKKNKNGFLEIFEGFKNNVHLVYILDKTINICLQACSSSTTKNKLCSCKRKKFLYIVANTIKNALFVEELENDQALTRGNAITNLFLKYFKKFIIPQIRNFVERLIQKAVEERKNTISNLKKIQKDLESSIIILSDSILDIQTDLMST